MIQDYKYSHLVNGITYMALIPRDIFNTLCIKNQNEFNVQKTGSGVQIYYPPITNQFFGSLLKGELFHARLFLSNLSNTELEHLKESIQFQVLTPCTEKQNDLQNNQQQQQME